MILQKLNFNKIFNMYVKYIVCKDFWNYFHSWLFVDVHGLFKSHRFSLLEFLNSTTNFGSQTRFIVNVMNPKRWLWATILWCGILRFKAEKKITFWHASVIDTPLQSPGPFFHMHSIHQKIEKNLAFLTIPAPRG